MKLAPAGITVRAAHRRVLRRDARGPCLQGVPAGRAPPAASCPRSLADVPLDFGTLEAHGCFIGSAAVVVLSDRDDIRAVALNLMRFFADESCGQCTPCRCGTEKAVELMERPDWDVPLADRAERRDARRLDLRARPGGAEPAALRSCDTSRRTLR